MYPKLSIDLTVEYDQQRNNVPGRVFIINIPSSYIFTKDDRRNLIKLLATTMRDLDYSLKILISPD
jgi:hypothetical protein